MGRTKGATNQRKPPPALAMSVEQRLNLLANIVLEIVSEEYVRQ
jgi:hypothetical protein